jgi:HYR domain-containing protein
VQFATAGSPGNGAIDDSGTVNIGSSALTGNGPVLNVESSGMATVTNSTISDGLDVGIVDTGAVTLINSTVTRNPDGGIDNANGTLTLINSIVAKNGSPDCTAPATTTDDSLDGDGTCGVGALSSKNPQLASLNFHGGSSPVDVPASTSPALRAGDPAACPAVDQRGAARRSVGGQPCDIGSVETYYGVPPTSTTAPVKVASTDPAGTVGTFTPTWSGGAPVTGVSCAPASGSVFPVGTTTVNCTGTDVFANSARASFTVTDVLAAPPVITAPANITTGATSAQGAVVTYPAASASDTVDGTDPVSCVPASGSGFAAGKTTIVTCTATDSRGLTASATFTITVGAFAPPSGPQIALPDPLSVAPTSRSGAVVTYATPTAADPIDGADPVTCTPASGSQFPITTTSVVCSATDSAGRTATGSFDVTVRPADPPVITVPPDIATAATGPGGAEVTYAVTATDPHDGAVPVTCTPASGSTFAIGTTPVTCMATDSLSSTSTAGFAVTVTQSTPPTVTIPADMTVAATSPAGAKVIFVVSAADPVNGALTPTCTPASGSMFPIGATVVTCTATNEAAPPLSASASFTVTVPPPSAPVITVPAFREVGALTKAGDPVTYVVTAADQIDKTDPVTCSPPPGTEFPIGITNVMCTATDSGGRTSTATFQVQVDPPDSSASASALTLGHPTVKSGVISVGLKLARAGRVVAVARFKVKVKGKATTVRFGIVEKTLKAGSRKLSIGPNAAGGAALAALSKSQRLAITLSVSLTPKGGKAQTKRVTLSLGRVQGA